MINNSKQAWEAGEGKQKWEVGKVVRVGFIRLKIVAKIAAPGNDMPDQYAMTDRKGERFYRFVPYHGLTRCESLADASCPI